MRVLVLSLFLTVIFSQAQASSLVKFQCNSIKGDTEDSATISGDVLTANGKATGFASLIYITKDEEADNVNTIDQEIKGEWYTEESGYVLEAKRSALLLKLDPNENSTLITFLGPAYITTLSMKCSIQK